MSKARKDPQRHGKQILGYIASGMRRRTWMSRAARGNERAAQKRAARRQVDEETR